MKKSIERLLEALPATKRSLGMMLMIFLFSSILEVFGIGIIGPFISVATNPSEIYQYSALNWAYQNFGFVQEEPFIVTLGGVIFFVYCLKTLTVYLTQVTIIKFSDRQQKLLIMKLAKGYFEASYIYHSRKNSSAIIDFIIEIANRFTTTILMPILTTTSNLIVSTFLFIFLLSTSPISVIIFLGVLLPIIYCINLFKPKVVEWGKRVRRSKEGIIRHVNHGFGGIKEVKVIGCEPYFEEKILEMTSLLEESHVKFSSFQIVPRYLMELVMVLCVVITISVSLVWTSDNNLTSTLGVFALASIRLIPSVSNCLNGINKLRNSSYTISQICLELAELAKYSSATLSIHPSTADDLATQNRRKVLFNPSPMLGNNRFHSADNKRFNKISIEDISYSYEGSINYAIKNMSLDIFRGESIAFVGKSGSGKTTLADIILGLLTPQHGDIKLDGSSIYTDLNAWQNTVGYIPQSIFLMDDTIERNIAFGVPDHEIDIDKIYEAIDLAQLTEVIDNLPEGIKTGVGERGVLLSGGQRQRVGIARCLYHDREILVLDEATAALDNNTERLVTDAIRSLSGRKTLITIAHRLSTIEHCDRVYHLANGEIINAGKYADVQPFLTSV